MSKFVIGEQVEFRLYSQIMKGIVKQLGKGGYYIESQKRDLSRRMVPITLFVKEANVMKIQVKQDD